MNRYTQSLLISLFFYNTLFICFFWFTNYLPEHKNKHISENIVKIAMVECQAKKSIKSTEQIIQETKDVAKKVQNQYEPKNIKKMSNLSNNKPRNEYRANKETQVQNITKQTNTNNENNTNTKNSDSDIEAQKDKYIQNIKNAIKRNKSYPMIVRKMEQEDVVYISFSVGQNRYPASIVCDSKYQSLSNASKDAINKSFPISVPNDISHKMPLHITLSLAYNLTED